MVVGLGVANFLVFVVVSAALGGDALSGRVTDGHYYVVSHGALTEVSESVWTLSRIHGAITLLSWPLVLVAMAFLLFRYVFPFLMSGKAPGQAPARVAEIRASGGPSWQGSPGGVAGGLNASKGLLGATVYPGGIVVTPRFMESFAIRADEIRSVRLGRRLISPTIEVEHAGIDVASPLVLYGGPESPQAVAILALASAGVSDDATPPVGPTVEAAPAPRLDAAPEAIAKVPGLMRALGVLGLVVAAVMAVVGILVVIPSLGVFGVAWTGMALLILVINGRRFLRRGW
jgi:hypothetical protein